MMTSSHTIQKRNYAFWALAQLWAGPSLRVRTSNLGPQIGKVPDSLVLPVRLGEATHTQSSSLFAQFNKA